MLSYVIHCLLSVVLFVQVTDTLYFGSSRSRSALSDGAAQVVAKASHFPSAAP